MSRSALAVELDRLPALTPLFARALALAAVRPQGVSPRAAELPPLSVRVSGVVADATRLARYREVCATRGSAELLPPAFPETFFIGLMARLVTHRAFPLSPLGLIHVRQTVVQHQPLGIRDALALTCRLAASRVTERGVEVDWGMEVEVHGERRWEGAATLLSRTRAAHGTSARAPTRVAEAGEPARLVAEIDVPEPTGRRYARASGDWNPHHLWSFTARPLGFRRPIAHGMWTLARVLAALPGGGQPALRADVAFKQPIAMPGRMRLLASPESGGAPGSLAIEVCPASGEGLYLAGTVTPGG